MHNDGFRKRSGALLALAALTATAAAAEPVSAPQKPPAPDLKAFRDPATGELTAPTAQQAAELEAKRHKAVKRAPSPRALPQGGIGIRLDESHMSESLAPARKDKRDAKPGEK